MGVLWEEMSWDEIKEKINPNTVVIVVCGATEQHSIHLPVAADTYQAVEIVKRAAKLASEEVDVLIAPPLHFGRSTEEQNWPGTITLRVETYMRVIEDVCDCLINYGVQKIILHSGHGNNPQALIEVIRYMRDKHPDVIIGMMEPLGLIEDEIKEVQQSKLWGHSGEIETSLMLYLKPELVRKEKIRKPHLSLYEINRGNPMERMIEGPLYISWRVEDFSDTGAFGDPTLATSEKGKRLVDAFVKKYAELIIIFSRTEREDVYPVDM